MPLEDLLASLSEGDAAVNVSVCESLRSRHEQLAESRSGNRGTRSRYNLHCVCKAISVRIQCTVQLKGNQTCIQLIT